MSNRVRGRGNCAGPGDPFPVDTDGDGLTDADEFLTHVTNASLADGEGPTDSEEGLRVRALGFTFEGNIITYATSLERQYLSVAGLDGNGDNDMVVAFSGKFGGRIAWHPNLDEAEGLGAQQVIHEAAGSEVGFVAAGDLDGDGDLDLAAPHNTGDRVA